MLLPKLIFITKGAGTITKSTGLQVNHVLFGTNILGTTIQLEAKQWTNRP